MADTSITREERYLEYLTGDRKGNVPKPVTRRERYLYELCLKGMGGEISPEEIKNAVNEYLEKNPVKPGATTEQAQQIEQNKTDITSLKVETNSLKEDLSNKITKFYASSQGETHITDSDNGKIMDMMVYGKSEQKQYSGKNLVDASKVITGDLQEGIVGNGNNYITDYVEIDDSEEYIISGCLKSDYENAFYDENKQYTRRDFSYTIIPQKGEKYVRIEYVNNGDKKIMLEKGSEATSFEPYTGGIPSPNHDYPQEIKSVVNPTVKVCGKNLLNPTLQTTTKNGVTCTANGDGTYTLNGTASDTTLFLIVQEGTNISNGTYKVTGCPSGGSSEKYYIRCGSESVAAWNDNGDGCTAIISNGRMVYRIVVVAGVTVNNLLFKPMLTTDLTATYDDYEPYHEQIVTLPYTLNAIPVNSGGNITIDGQQYIADYVDAERGKLVRMVEKKVLNGTEDWKLNERSGNRNGVFYIYVNANIAGALCDKAIYESLTSHYGTFDTWYGQIRFYAHTNEMTLEEWCNFLSSNNHVVYIIRNTSEEIDLTSEEIAAFKALATYYPTTNISVNSEQLDGYTVFNYPMPFEDEWIKTKKDVDLLKTRLNDIVGYDNAAAHNAIYRGKNLGTQFTAEMSANIKNGTFKDLYCGDYLIINGTTYRFMDLNYLFKTGDTSLEINHILVVPDAPMYNHVMNDTNTTEGGYVGSKMYTSGLDQALAKVKADFGEAHIVTYRNLLVDAVSGGVPSSWAWYSRQIDLMNEEMVYGTRAWSQATQNGYDTGSNKSQLAAFKHNHSLISSCRSWHWLRAVCSSSAFCGVGGDGDVGYAGASDANGVRPCFLIS